MDHKHFDKDGKYIGPERRILDRRKMVLREDDISIIAKIVEEKHKCRYDISPEDMKIMMNDMKDIVGFVRYFKTESAVIKKETKDFIIKKVIPRLIVGAILTALADYLGFLRPVLNAILKAVRGG